MTRGRYDTHGEVSRLEYGGEQTVAHYLIVAALLGAMDDVIVLRTVVGAVVPAHEAVMFAGLGQDVMRRPLLVGAAAKEVVDAVVVAHVALHDDVVLLGDVSLTGVKDGAEVDGVARRASVLPYRTVGQDNLVAAFVC